MLVNTAPKKIDRIAVNLGFTVNFRQVWVSERCGEDCHELDFSKLGDGSHKSGIVCKPYSQETAFHKVAQ